MSRDGNYPNIDSGVGEHDESGHGDPFADLRPGVRVTLSHGITGTFVGWKNDYTLRVFMDRDPHNEATFHKSWLEAVDA